MSISEEFFDIFTKLGRLRLKAVERELLPMSLSHTDLNILMFLYDKNSCTQEDLSAQATVDRSNVGRALKKLEARSLIAREKNPKDQRTFIITLTDQGKKLKKKTYKIKERVVDLFSNDLSQKELETLVKLLSKIDISF